MSIESLNKRVERLEVCTRPAPRGPYPTTPEEAEEVQARLFDKLERFLRGEELEEVADEPDSTGVKQQLLDKLAAMQVASEVSHEQQS